MQFPRLPTEMAAKCSVLGIMGMEIRSYTHHETTLGPSETSIKISTDSSSWPFVISFKLSVAYF